MSHRLAWGNPPPGIHNFPVHLGVRRGLIGPGYAIHENLTGQDYTRELVARRFDLGVMGTPPFFAALAQGAPYRLVAQGVYNYPPFDLLVAPGITSMADLAAAPVGINKLDTCPHSVVRTALRLHGMAEDAVIPESLVTGDDLLDAIEAGCLKAATLWEPYTSYARVELGWTVLLEGRQLIKPSNYGIVAYASADLVDTAPEQVNRFLDTYGQAVADARATEDIAWYAERFSARLAPHVEAAVRTDRLRWAFDPRVDWPLLYRVEEELTAQGVITPALVLETYVEEGFTRNRVPARA